VPIVAGLTKSLDLEISLATTHLLLSTLPGLHQRLKMNFSFKKFCCFLFSNHHRINKSNIKNYKKNVALNRQKNQRSLSLTCFQASNQQKGSYFQTLKNNNQILNRFKNLDESVTFRPIWRTVFMNSFAEVP